MVHRDGKEGETEGVTHSGESDQLRVDPNVIRPMRKKINVEY